MAKMALFNIIVHRRIDLPTAIGIEISTACNRRCVYCPQSVAPTTQSFIENAVWYQFLYRLAELKWKGATAITKYNEPSLNKNSSLYVQQLRSLGCRPIIFSNGDKPDAVREWCEAGAFRVRITEHPPYRDQWLEKLRPVIEKYPNQVIVSRLPIIFNQAGMVEGEKMERCYSSHGISCNIDGTVSMCCVDYKSENLIGDIKTQSIKEIWNSQKHRRIRSLVIRGIPATKLCVECLVPKAG